MNKVSLMLLIFCLLPFSSQGQTGEKKEAMAKLQNQAAACKKYLSEKSNPQERDILAEIVPCGIPEGHPMKAVPQDFLRSMQQLDRHLNKSQYEKVLNETQKTALYNNYVSHLSMSEHMHGVRSFENRKLGLLETLNKSGGPKGDPFIEAMKLKAVNDYVQQVPVSRVTSFWDQDLIQTKTKAFNGAVDELNRFCKAATKKDNAAFKAVVSSAAAGATGAGTTAATYGAKKHAEDQNIVKAKQLVGKLYNTDYGKLLFSSSFSGHVGVFDPSDCVNGKWGGLTDMELKKIPTDKTARDRMLRAAVTDLDTVVMKQARDLAKDREALKKGTSVEDQADVLKKYLKGNPAAFRALLANKSNPQDFLLACHLIGEILDSDRNNQYIDYATTTAAVAAAGLLGASVVGAPIGAALLAAVGTASSVATITNAGFQYTQANRDASLYVSGGVSNNKAQGVALHSKQKSDLVKEENVRNAVLEVAPIAAAGALKLGGKMGRAAGAVEHVTAGRTVRSPATQYFHSFSGKQAEAFVDFKKSVNFEKLSPVQQQELLDKMYKVHMANNTPGDVASIGKKRDLVELEAYLRDKLKVDPKVARDQVRALADKDVKILGAEVTRMKYVQEPFGPRADLMKFDNSIILEKLAKLSDIKSNSAYLSSSRTAAENDYMILLDIAKKKAAQGLMTQDELQSIGKVGNAGAPAPKHVAAPEAAASAKPAQPAVDKETFYTELKTKYTEEAIQAEYKFVKKSKREDLQNTKTQIDKLQDLKKELLHKGESAGIESGSSDVNVRYRFAVKNIDNQISVLAKKQKEVTDELESLNKTIKRATTDEYTKDGMAYAVSKNEGLGRYKVEITDLKNKLVRIKEMRDAKEVTSAELSELKNVDLEREIEKLDARLKQLE